jgi:hypothetical protein
MSRKDKKNFSTRELDILLTLVEERLPFGQEEWDSLALEYHRRLSRLIDDPYTRNGMSLRTKFKHLKNKRKPTGDPTCPPEVVRAKRAYRAIESRMEVVNLNDDGDGNGPDSQEDDDEDMEDMDGMDHAAHEDNDDDDDDDDDDGISAPTANTAEATRQEMVIASIAAKRAAVRGVNKHVSDAENSSSTGVCDASLPVQHDTTSSRPSAKSSGISLKGKAAAVLVPPTDQRNEPCRKNDKKPIVCGMNRVGCNLGSKVPVNMSSEATIRRSNLDKMIVKMTEQEEAAIDADRRATDSFLAAFQKQQELENQRENERDKRHEELWLILCTALGGRMSKTDRGIENASASEGNLSACVDTVPPSMSASKRKRTSIEIDADEYQRFLTHIEDNATHNVCEKLDSPSLKHSLF